MPLRNRRHAPRHSNPRRVLPLGHRPRSEPSKPAAESIGPCGAVRRAARPSPLRVRRGPRPKPRGMAGISPPARARGAQSTQPRTTWRWGQSGANPSLGLGSLIRRENTGNSPGFEGTGGRRGAENARSPGTLGEISLGPGAGNDGPAIRELPAGRQGSPLDSFQAGPSNRCLLQTQNSDLAVWV
jgi:hypothetical protein